MLAPSFDHTLRQELHQLAENKTTLKAPTTSEKDADLYEVIMTSPTAEWEKVGDKFYRKIQLYTAVFDQDLELENYVVTGCSYGGAIGVLKLPYCALPCF